MFTAARALYIQSLRPGWLSLGWRRSAPRRAAQSWICSTSTNDGIFQPVTSNNLTLSFVEPFVSLDGTLGEYVHYDVGFRQEEVWMNNQDLINPQNSFDRLATLTLPKATLTFLPPANDCIFRRWRLATEKRSTPKIHESGRASGADSVGAVARLSTQILQGDQADQFNITLRRVSNSQELAKIDPDTGLQDDIGPSLNRVHCRFAPAKLCARGLICFLRAGGCAKHQTGEPVPEAPRLIWDAVASYNHLPFGLQARGEFEYVRASRLVMVLLAFQSEKYAAAC